MPPFTNPPSQVDSQLLDYLPTWMASATSAQLQVLSQALRLSQQHKKRLRQAMSGLQSIDKFTLPLLAQTLRDQTGVMIDCQRSQFLHTRHVSRTSTLLSLPRAGSIEQLSKHSLLQAALQNFTDSESAANGFAGNAQLLLVDSPSLAAPPTPEQFATWCRALDLGGKYQAHLNDVFTSGLLEQLKDSKQYDLTLALCIAAIKTDIDDYSKRALRALINDTIAGAPDRNVIRTFQITAMGVVLHDVLVFKILPESAFLGSTLFHRRDEYIWILYIPGDPVQPLTQRSSFAELVTELGKRLQSPVYERFFCHFAAQRQRRTLSTGLNRLRQTSEHGSLRPTVHLLPITTHLFETLATQYVTQIRADARFFAVPTADEDQQSRLQRLHDFELASEVLLNAAALFVPLLGEIMLSIAAIQLTSEIFESIEDWSVGETDEALDHLASVVENLALIAATATGVQLVNWTLRRSSFVEKLVPVELGAGQRRLWNPDLSAYEIDDERVTGLKPDAQGLVTFDGQEYVCIQGKFYAVELDTSFNQWRVRHESKPEKYAPPLSGNEQGRWRHSGENPLLWQDGNHLLRRLDPELAELDDQTLRQIRDVSGLDEDRLRQLHLDNEPLPGILSDTLLRFRLNKEVDQQLSHPQADTSLAARQTLFDQAYQRSSRVTQPSEAIVQIDFPGLPGAVAQELVATATDSERERLLQHWRVPLSMTERIREQLRLVRISRAMEGVYLHVRQRIDTATLALQVLAHVPDWPQDIAIELYDHVLNARHVLTIDNPSALRRFRLVSTTDGFELHTTAGALVHSADDLFDCLAQVLLPAEQARMGLDSVNPGLKLRELIAAQISTRRPQVPGWLGLTSTPKFNAPSRLADGQVGYALSGRGLIAGRRAAQVRNIRKVYPGLTDADAVDYIESLQQTGVDVTVRIGLHQRQLSRLDRILAVWQRPISGDPLEREALTRSRQQAAVLIRRAWRKLSPKRLHNQSVIGYSLNLEGLRVGELPLLPTDIPFDHVVDVCLANMDLTDSSASFLKNFIRVSDLDLSNNALARIPESLQRMPSLARLNLRHNQITLTAHGASILNEITLLRRLDLSENPVGPLLNLQRAFRLEEVLLRNCNLQTWPDGLVNRVHSFRLDLRNNGLASVPDAILEAPARLNRAVALQGNPLSEETLLQLAQYHQRTGIRLAPLQTPVRPVERARAIWLQRLPEQEQAQAQIKWQALQTEPRSEEFFKVLANLSGTADFQQTYPELNQRVWALIDAGHDNSALREELFQLAATPTTCGDSVSVVFSELETKVAVYRAKTFTDDEWLPSRLLTLARQLFRQKCLDDLVIAAVNAQPPTAVPLDAVELSLKYRIALGQVLDLPSKPQRMLFPNLVNLDEQQLQQARQTIEHAEQSPALQRFICDQDFWCDYLEGHYTDKFDSLLSRFLMQQEDIMSIKEELTDGEFLSRMRTLALQQHEAKQAVIENLTHQEWQAFTD